MFGLFFGPEAGDDVPPKRQFTLNGLHVVIPQKAQFLQAKSTLKDVEWILFRSVLKNLRQNPR